MNTKQSFDLIVVGAGSGGLTAARLAASFGIKVALLEGNKIGGDCLHTGCVPSKTLISIAREIAQLDETAKYIPIKKGKLNFNHIFKAVHASTEHIQKDTDNIESLKADGVTTIMGNFSFQNAHSLISQEGDILNFKRCILATGSRPTVPDITGIEETPYLTSDTIWELDALPESLAILGAGPIGLELGQAFAMLGTQVIIFERSERIVSRFDTEVSQALASGLRASGVKINYNTTVASIAKHESGIKISYKQGDSFSDLTASRLLIAVGRTPNTENLQLSKTAIALNGRGGIETDSKSRTNRKHIYAIGDCVAGPLFTHWAAEQGARAARHAIIGFGSAPDSRVLPTTTFTTPEVAQVGKFEQDLKSSGVSYQKVILPYGNIDKAVAEQQDGKITIFMDARRRLLGAYIIGHNASELIGYYAYLMHRRLPVDELASGIQAYPTYSFGLKQQSGNISIDKYADKLLIKLLIRIRGIK